MGVGGARPCLRDFVENLDEILALGPGQTWGQWCEENGRCLLAMILSSRVCVEYRKGLHTEKLLWFIVNLLFEHRQIFSSI